MIHTGGRILSLPSVVATAVPPDLEGAIRWCLAKRQVTEQFLIQVPQRASLNEHKALVRAADRHDTLVGTWQRRASGWSGGPALAAWPDRQHLAELLDDRRTTSLCVLPWGDDELRAWVRARRPERLGLHLAVPEAEEPLVQDPVVRAAMKTITILAHEGRTVHQDRLRVNEVLLLLRRDGRVLVPEELEAWALANNWTANGAMALADLAKPVIEGRNVRRSPLAEGLLARWHEDADEPEGGNA